ncbi:multiple sugar transport system permease protein [Kineosphaera limosa]|uniref:Putative sugar ABC transporter permease protein n=1 Tax=Kineosphaera limosa NBRC 100340 TaxID=1184609 RepID=K6WWB9_9MICO|nr:carbohydrate ABC transporter permease [Kineosphaera limosa]NYE00765.1 multiple sugar transport system permease protein [Kineosphaera limosa]GAB96377.1 putative sugar ABC transporter permease protein [Kineosphaera limosa NBRC 100340]
MSTTPPVIGTRMDANATTNDAGEARNAHGVRVLNMERLSAPKRRRRNQPAWLGSTIANIVLLVAVAYALLPALWLFIASTKNLTDLFGTNGFAFGNEFHLWSNITYLFQTQDGIYLRWMLNTIGYAGGGALLAALLAVMAGYAFDKYDFGGKEKLFGLVLVGVMIPATALALPTYLLASKIGLTDTYLGVFLPGLVFPFGVYLARIFSAANVPDALIDAARVDGASEMRTFFSVALPILRPGFVTILLFQFTAIWNSFFLPLVMLSDPKLYPVNLGLYVWNTTALSQGNPDDYLLAITGSLISIVPLVLLFMTLQRFWRSGMTAGALD